MNRNIHVIGIHTFGLGDAVMAIPAIMVHSNILNGLGVKIEFIVKENSVLEYFRLKNTTCIQGSTKTFIYKVLASRFKGNKVLSFKTAGGTKWKNIITEKLLGFIGVKFISGTSNCRLISVNYNYRALENLNILNEALEHLYDLSEYNKSLNTYAKRFQYLSTAKQKAASIHPCIPNSLPIEKDRKVRKILFHFGAGDTLFKELSKQNVGRIVSLYKSIYPKSECILIVGPRDKTYDVSIMNSVEVIGRETVLSIKDLFNMSKHTDLFVCNDTGLGHIFSSEGVPVDLFINKKNMARIHHVLPPTIDNIILI